ncbi:MAG: sensor histidine kinase [Chryseolinea sp.]
MTTGLSTIAAFGGAIVFEWKITNSFVWYFSICIPIVILFSGFGMFLTLGRKSFIDVQLSQEHKDRELQFLRSQLSPHFLFNTLNNLYGLAITQPALMPPLLLRLSDLLRYSVYDARETQVMLQEEINYIRNYVELEKIRLGDRLHLSLHLESGSVKIPPMLLVTFVENAFKHGSNTINSQINIAIDLHLTANCLHFQVRNSFDQQGHVTSLEHSGVGLQNAVKRLQLIYPNNFLLDSGSQDDYYIVTLKLDLNA